MQMAEDTVITVDAKSAGKGKVTCTVLTPNGMEADMDVVENPDGTFDIYYTAPEPGKYVITIRFGGQHIPNSPFHVTVSNVSKCLPTLSISYQSCLLIEIPAPNPIRLQRKPSLEKT